MKDISRAHATAEETRSSTFAFRASAGQALSAAQRWTLRFRCGVRYGQNQSEGEGRTKQDDSLKSLSKLVEIYFNTVGRNAVLLLNLSPDKRGLLTGAAASRLQKLGAYLRSTFTNDLANGAQVKASNTRNGAENYAAQSVVAPSGENFWVAEENCGPVELELSLPRMRKFNVVMLQEKIELGQKVESFGIDVWKEDGWREVARGTTVGYKRLLRFEAVETDKVRIRITESRVCPTLARVGLFLAPQITRP